MSFPKYCAGGMILGADWDALTDAVLDRAAAFFSVPNPDANIGTYDAVQMLDGGDTVVGMKVPLPSGFNLATWHVEALIVAGGTGDMRRSVAASCHAPGELYNTHTGTVAAGQVAMVINIDTQVDLLGALTGGAAGDIVGVEFTRHGGHGSDTVGATCWFLGILIRRP